MKKLYLLVFVFFAGIYGWIIEPNWIQVNQFQVKVPLITPIRIMQISDLHTDGLGFVESRIIHKIHELKPDIIVLTGDLSSPGSSIYDYEEVLSQIKAPGGVFFVTGNWEYWTAVKGFNKMLEKNHVTILDDKKVQIGENIWLVGFDDALEGNPNPKKTLEGIPDGVFKVGIFHTPIFFDQIHKDINLSLSGHTHAGQVRIPFIKPLWLPAGSGEYAEGWFKKGENSMYVSRGIGMSIIPFRYFCRPEIAVFDLGKF